MSHFTPRIRLIFIKIFSALRLSNFFSYEEAIRYWGFPEMFGERKPNLDVFLKVLSFRTWREKADPGERNTVGTMVVVTTYMARGVQCLLLFYIYLENWQIPEITKKNVMGSHISTTKSCLFWIYLFQVCVSISTSTHTLKVVHTFCWVKTSHMCA